MQHYARNDPVATVRAQFVYETCTENYGRTLCGKPLFGNLLAFQKERQRLNDWAQSQRNWFGIPAQTGEDR